MRVAVVGGGAVGVTVAHDLAQGGADVRLYERDEELGDDYTHPRERVEGSSHRAAGVLAPRPTDAVGAEIAERAMDRFEWLADRDHRFDVEPTPQVTLVGADAELKQSALREAVDAARDHGVDVACHDPDSIRDRFPELDLSEVGLAAVTERAAYATPGPGAYVSAMADRARDAGVDCWTGVEAGVSHRGDGPRVDRERFDAVVVAGGGWTKRVLAPTGIRLPLKPYRVQALVSGADYAGPMVHDADAGVYFRPHPEGLLAGDGTVPEEVDPDDWDPRGDDWFVDDTLAAIENRTGFDEGSTAAWAGIATATPDGEPLLGEVEPGLYVATGWHGHGFLRAPATGEVLAEQVLGERDAVAAYDPGRFDGVPEFAVEEGMSL
ncbi:FAD-binding oxidoreductase [Halolamina sp. CBA1230]|uniref:NAD(P)/FAD-dependent oxidoreductase n=1 Tax=Halolamina sp. CBA1230 TaxID=1853690 RepID=UPI0009A234C5|nr:FAD-dependent oxidoreductase [Halolamina sp. CBA1230]QKY20375.1 FAD-binding oxidoreductase [Halolamina sp. CBA1230]